MPSMARTAGNGAEVSNYENPNGKSFRYYEQTYSQPGAQEWITMADAGKTKVVVAPNGGYARLEGTCSPPNDILGNLVSPSQTGIAIPTIYIIQDDITDNTAILVEGDTAIRLVSGAPGATISVRA